MIFVETRGGTRKDSINCCSVWAWRKSGIKILVTAGGLLFFTYFQILKKGSIFATFLVTNKESSSPGTQFWLLDPQIRKKWRGGGKKWRGGEKSDEAGKKVTRREKKWRGGGKKWRGEEKVIRGPDFHVWGSEFHFFAANIYKFTTWKGFEFVLANSYFLDEAEIIISVSGEEFVKFGGPVLAGKVKLANWPPLNCPAPNPLRATRPSGLHGFHYPLFYPPLRPPNSRRGFPPPFFLKQYIYIYIDGGGTLASSVRQFINSSPRPSLL